MICKKTGRELVNTESPYALGQYLYERFDADQAASFYERLCDLPNLGREYQSWQAQAALGGKKTPIARRRPLRRRWRSGLTRCQLPLC